MDRIYADDLTTKLILFLNKSGCTRMEAIAALSKALVSGIEACLMLEYPNMQPLSDEVVRDKIIFTIDETIKYFNNFKDQVTHEPS